jgi:DNA 3'-phosphatase
VHRGSFATDAHDWAWFNPQVLPRLKALHASGYRLVVFRCVQSIQGVQRRDTRSAAVRVEPYSLVLLTCGPFHCSRVNSNQNGIKTALEGKRAATVKGYFDNAFREVCTSPAHRCCSSHVEVTISRLALIPPHRLHACPQLGVPITAFMAPQDDKYRKGSGTAMWRLFVRDHCAGVAPDLATSFFVGDAAGRPADHGSGDKDFAAAVGLTFHVPETVFAAGWAIPGGEEPDAAPPDEEVIVIT